MRPCSDIEPELSAYHDGELPPAERAVVQEHLAGCAACQTALAAIEVARVELSSLPKFKSPAALRGRIIGQLAPQAAAKRPSNVTPVRFGWAALASGLAATLMLGVLGYTYFIKPAQDIAAKAPDTRAKELKEREGDEEIGRGKREVSDSELTTDSSRPEAEALNKNVPAGAEKSRGWDPRFRSEGNAAAKKDDSRALNEPARDKLDKDAGIRNPVPAPAKGADRTPIHSTDQPVAPAAAAPVTGPATPAKEPAKKIAPIAPIAEEAKQAETRADKFAPRPDAYPPGGAPKAELPRPPAPVVAGPPANAPKKPEAKAELVKEAGDDAPKRPAVTAAPRAVTPPAAPAEPNAAETEIARKRAIEQDLKAAPGANTAPAPVTRAKRGSPNLTDGAVQDPKAAIEMKKDNAPADALSAAAAREQQLRQQDGVAANPEARSGNAASGVKGEEEVNRRNRFGGGFGAGGGGGRGGGGVAKSEPADAKPAHEIILRSKNFADTLESLKAVAAARHAVLAPAETAVTESLSMKDARKSDEKEKAPAIAPDRPDQNQPADRQLMAKLATVPAKTEYVISVDAAETAALLNDLNVLQQRSLALLTEEVRLEQAEPTAPRATKPAAPAAPTPPTTPPPPAATTASAAPMQRDADKANKIERPKVAIRIIIDTTPLK